MTNLHLISHPHFFDGEAQVVSNILEQSDVLFHLRKPDSSDEEYAAFVRQIPSKYYKQMVLHSAYHLNEGPDFAALHFSTSKREGANALEDDVTKSTSCHSVMEAMTLSQTFDSCFLSPVFSSISKPGYDGHLDLEEVNDFLSSPRRIKVIALGGIDKDTVAEAQEMGFDAVAVLGAVWGNNPKAGNDFLGRIAAIQSNMIRPFCLSIAGFDASAGAGVLSDVKTFEANGVYGLGVNSAITYQNDAAFEGVDWLSVDSIKRQIKPLAKYNVKVVKVGLIESFDMLKEVLRYVRSLFPNATVIWDPILKASAGFTFHLKCGLNAEFLEYIDIITPNAEEYEALRLDLRKSSTITLLKGGHRTDKNGIDTLFYKGKEMDIEGTFIPNKIDKHGTGCVLSSALAANLAKGYDIEKAARLAKRYVEGFIQSNSSNLGYHQL